MIAVIDYRKDNLDIVEKKEVFANEASAIEHCRKNIGRIVCINGKYINHHKTNNCDLVKMLRNL